MFNLFNLFRKQQPKPRPIISFNGSMEELNELREKVQKGDGKWAILPEGVTPEYTTHFNVDFDELKTERLELVKDGDNPWNYKVFLDGVEVKKVARLVLTIDVHKVPSVELTAQMV